jgi:hypothetical protein
MRAFDPTADLRSYIDTLPGDCNSAALLDVLRRTRQVLDKEGLRSTYATLALYCDWHFHVDIDRHERGWNMLSLINSIMCGGSPTVHPAEAIRQALGLSRLRGEFQALYRSRHVRTFLFDDDTNWAKFGGLLLQALSHKRLKWPSVLKGKAKIAHKQMLQHVLRPDLYPRELCIDHRPSGHEGPGFYWTVGLAAGPHSVEFTGQLAPTQAAAA